MAVISIIPILQIRADARETETALTALRARLRATEAMKHDTSLLEDHVDDLEEDFLEMSLIERDLIREAKSI